MENTSIRDTSVPTGKDIIQFAADHRVSLESGDYSLILKPTLSVQTAQGRVTSLDPDTHKRKQDFSIRSERFQIPSNLVRSVFPANGSKGDYWSSLPHIVLERSTLPWERSAVFPEQTNDTPPPTWLALLVFHEEDPFPEVQTQTLNGTRADSEDTSPVQEVPPLAFLKQSRQENQDFEADIDQKVRNGEDKGAPKMLWESGDNSGQQVHTIQVHLRHLPSKDELIPLTHVRRRLAFLSEYSSLEDAQDFLQGTFGASVQAYDDQNDYSVGLPVEGADATLVAAKATVYKDYNTGELYEVLEYDDANGIAQKFKVYHLAHEAATVVANRLPQPGAKNVVHLVSVEQRYWEDSEVFEGRNTAEERADPMVKLISLYQWSFYCEEETYTFQGLLRGLNGSESSGQPGTLRLPKLSDGSEPFLQRGFVPLRHRFRDGSRSVSWYHGPLVPASQQLNSAERAPIPGLDFVSEHSTLDEAKEALQAIAPAFNEVPNGISVLPDDVTEAQSFKDTNTQKLFVVLLYASGSTPYHLFRAHKADFLDIRQADQLLIYDTTNGMFDVAYSAAWELGRSLTLANTKLAQQLYNWKKRQNQTAAAGRHIATNGFHILGARGLIPNLSDDAAIWKWLDELAAVRHIPFQYLVPDERMLPPESIRLFSLDQRWIACLQDGAFSIGRVSPKDAAADNAYMHARESRYNQPVLSGFLLRSKLISAYPEMKIVAYHSLQNSDGDPTIPVAMPPESEDVPGLLPLFQKRKLSSEVLLVLFKGEVDIIDFFLPAEALHFGFYTDKIEIDPEANPQDKASNYPDQLTVRPRDPGTGLVVDTTGGNDLPIKLKTYYSTDGMRILNIDEMHTDLRNGNYLPEESGRDSTVHSGTIALQLLQSNELIRFQRNNQ